MGLTHVTASIGPLTGRKRYEAEFLVDTGAIDCLVPASELKRVGIKPEGRDVYELANGKTVELPVGFARIRFMGAETVTKVIFGDEDAEPLLGVVALESTGFGVNPVTRKLHRMTAKPLKRARRARGARQAPPSRRLGKAKRRREIPRPPGQLSNPVRDR